MMDLNPNPHPLKLAAIVYRPADDVDGLLAAFASDLICQGNRVGGIVRRNARGAGGTPESIELIDLMTGAAIRVCQPAGSAAGACKLDPAGLAEAAAAVSRAVAANVDLVIVNKFSKQDAAGGRLRAEIADAVAAGRPLLTAVPDKSYDAWAFFTGRLRHHAPVRAPHRRGLVARDVAAGKARPCLGPFRAHEPFLAAPSAGHCRSARAHLPVVTSDRSTAADALCASAGKGLSRRLTRAELALTAPPELSALPPQPWFAC